MKKGREIKKLVRITTVPMSLEKLLENQLRFMKKFYDITAVSSDALALKKFGLEQGVKTHHIELTRRITLVKDLKATYKLYKFLKKEKPFIVHTHTPKAGVVGMLASFLAGVPNRLHTVAGMPLTVAVGFKRKVLNVVEKLTYACATRVYPNSFGLQSIILENKFAKKEKLQVIGYGSSNGIDVDYFNPTLFEESELLKLKISLKITENDFVYVFVGRLVGDKGINELVNAFQKLTKEKEGIKLLLVGPFEDELDPLQEGSKIIIENNKHIIIVGFQKDVRPYFAISNLLVFPSYREGFPNVVMQAAAMKLPAIVSNINGCNEIISNNLNGVVIPVKNEALLFKEMLNFYNKPKEELTKMGSIAREQIKSKYKRQFIFKCLLDEYKKIEQNV